MAGPSEAEPHQSPDALLGADPEAAPVTVHYKGQVYEVVHPGNFEYIFAAFMHNHEDEKSEGLMRYSQEYLLTQPAGIAVTRALGEFIADNNNAPLIEKAIAASAMQDEPGRIVYFAKMVEAASSYLPEGLDARVLRDLNHYQDAA